MNLTDLKTCRVSPNVVACGGSKVARRLYGACETCQRRTRMVRAYGGPYYGCTTYCYSCMGKDCDGYWMPHTPHQYDEQDRAYIRGLWSTAVKPKEFDQWVRDYEREYWEAS